MLDIGRPLCLGLSRRGYPRLRLQLRSSFNKDDSPTMSLRYWITLCQTKYETSEGLLLHSQKTGISLLDPKPSPCLEPVDDQ